MIKLNPTTEEGHFRHSVECKENVGTFKKGNHYIVKIIPCKGRVYEHGFKMIGDRKVFDDNVGKPDNRLMVIEDTFKEGAYACQSKEVFDLAFNEADKPYL